MVTESSRPTNFQILKASIFQFYWHGESKEEAVLYCLEMQKENPLASILCASFLARVTFNRVFNTNYNSPIYDECQTQSAKVLVLRISSSRQIEGHPIGEFQARFVFTKDYELAFIIDYRVV